MLYCGWFMPRGTVSGGTNFYPLIGVGIRLNPDPAVASRIPTDDAAAQIVQHEIATVRPDGDDKVADIFRRDDNRQRNCRGRDTSLD